MAQDQSRQDQFAEEFVKRRRKGQAHAVTHMLDIVKRAVTGMANLRGAAGPGASHFSPARPVSEKPNLQKRSLACYSETIALTSVSTCRNLARSIPISA